MNEALVSAHSLHFGSSKPRLRGLQAEHHLVTGSLCHQTALKKHVRLALLSLGPVALPVELTNGIKKKPCSLKRPSHVLINRPLTQVRAH